MLEQPANPQKQSPQSQNNPHWAIDLLLDPRAPLPENLKPGEDYPAQVDFLKALGMFDQESLGWVPLWFPRKMNYQSISPQERLDWFDAALRHFAQAEWPPKGSLSSKKRDVAISLLHMLFVVELQELPTPDKL